MMASVIDKLRVQGSPAPRHRTLSASCGQDSTAGQEDSGVRLDAPPQVAGGDTTFLTVSEPNELTRLSPRLSASQAPAVISPGAHKDKTEVRHGRSMRTPVSLVFLTVPMATDCSCFSLAAGKNGVGKAAKQKCACLSDCVHGCVVRQTGGGQYHTASSPRQPAWRRHLTTSATSAVAMTMTQFELTGSKLARFKKSEPESPQSPNRHERPLAATSLRSALPGPRRGKLKIRHPPHLKDSSCQTKSADLQVICQCLHVLPNAHGLEQSGAARKLPSQHESVDLLGCPLEGRLEGRSRESTHRGQAFSAGRMVSESRRKFIFDSVARYIHFNKLCSQGKDAAMGKFVLCAKGCKELLQEPHLGGISRHYTDAILVQMLSDIRPPGSVHGTGLNLKVT